MAGKTYRVYRISAPSGKQYVGYTSMSLQERWRKHQDRALSGEALGHPFYDEIRSNPLEDFRVELLAWSNERLEAMQIEQEYIAQTPQELSMNLSSGGLNDSKEGIRMFWERLNANPEKRAEYLKKLSDIKRANDWSDYEYLAQCSAEWRKEHPREAYRMAYRAIRIANRVQGYPPPSQRRIDTRPLKERLMHKFKLNEIRRENAIRSWSGYSEEKRREIGEKISTAQKAHYQTVSQEEINDSCEHARSHIDRNKQGQAASSGLKKWWNELKADPIRYEQYMKQRTESLRKTLGEKVSK